VHGSDYRRSICDTADGSNCKIVNCVTVRASGINSLDPRRREVMCRVTYPTHDNMYTYYYYTIIILLLMNME
jgi:hypothetical protein